MEDRKNNPPLSPDELSVYQAAFNLFSPNGKYIEPQFIQNLFAKNGTPISMEEATYILRDLSNGSDRMSFDDFCQCIINHEELRVTPVPEKPVLKRSSSYSSQSPGSKQLASDSGDSLFSSFSSQSSSDPGTPNSTRRSQPPTPKPSPLRRETTVFGSQLLKFKNAIHGDIHQQFMRQTNDLMEIFDSLPKNEEGHVNTSDIRESLRGLGVHPDDMTMRHLDKATHLNLNQFRTLFQLKVE